MGECGYSFKKLKEEKQTPRFTISTMDIQEHLQNQIDMITSQLRKHKEEYANLENLKVKVTSLSASNRFTPIGLVLPKEAMLSEQNSGDENKQVPSVFMDRDEDDAVNLIPELANFLSILAYTKKEREQLKTSQTQRDLGINNGMAMRMIFMSEPRLRVTKRDGEADDTQVIVVLDPIKVIAEMIRRDNESTSAFDPIVERLNKVRSGEWKYTVKKSYRNGKNKDNSKTVDREIENMLRIGNR